MPGIEMHLLDPTYPRRSSWESRVSKPRSTSSHRYQAKCTRDRTRSWTSCRPSLTFSNPSLSSPTLTQEFFETVRSARSPTVYILAVLYLLGPVAATKQSPFRHVIINLKGYSSQLVSTDTDAPCIVHAFSVSLQEFSLRSPRHRHQFCIRAFDSAVPIIQHLFTQSQFAHDKKQSKPFLAEIDHAYTQSILD